MPGAARARFLSKNPLPLISLSILSVLLFVAPRAAAQSATATLDVVATDGSGGPLPGATVEVKRPSTGLLRTGVTGTAGLASFAALPPGTYDVSVKLQGFETVEQKGVVLLVGQSARVGVTLQGKRTESISVVATAPLVDVYKTDSSTNIMPEQIQDLPTPDRDFQRLAFVAPGVERERGAFRFVSGGPVIGGGGNASQATILVDGVDFTDPALGLAKTKFSQDAISEFRVIQNRFDAEIGGSSGGALSILTKSGTNTFAGSLFGFYRGRLAAREGRARAGLLDQLRARPVRRHGRRSDRQGPDALFRVVRADQLDDADPLPAAGRVQASRRGRQASVPPDARLRRRRPDAHGFEPAHGESRVRALPREQLPRRRGRRHHRTARSSTATT